MDINSVLYRDRCKAAIDSISNRLYYSVEPLRPELRLQLKDKLSYYWDEYWLTVEYLNNSMAAEMRANDVEYSNNN